MQIKKKTKNKMQSIPSETKCKCSETKRICYVCILKKKVEMWGVTLYDSWIAQMINSEISNNKCFSVDSITNWGWGIMRREVWEGEVVALSCSEKPQRRPGRKKLRWVLKNLSAAQEISLDAAVVAELHIKRKARIQTSLKTFPDGKHLFCCTSNWLWQEFS